MSHSRKYFFAKPQRKTRRERERKIAGQYSIYKRYMYSDVQNSTVYIRSAQKYNSLSSARCKSDWKPEHHSPQSQEANVTTLCALFVNILAWQINSIGFSSRVTLFEILDTTNVEEANKTKIYNIIIWLSEKDKSHQLLKYVKKIEVEEQTVSAQIQQHLSAQTKCCILYSNQETFIMRFTASENW